MAVSIGTFSRVPSANVLFVMHRTLCRMVVNDILYGPKIVSMRIISAVAASAARLA